jgi:hypothetical protein
MRITGFNTEDNGRFWNADGTLGVTVNEDDTVTLLDAEGYPANHTLPIEHAEHVLGCSRRDGDDAETTIRRWEYFASGAA